MRLRMAARREQVGDPDPDPMDSRSRKRAELLTAATGSGKSPRVALEQQVLSQVPPRAVRYRLVLGVEQQFHTPVMAPEDSAWNLMPFEAPDDLRLLPGHTYRIVWLDRDGKTVKPLQWAPAPSLHFFLGEPDAEISAQQVESRYQTQTLMQLRQQVQQLEQQLARAKRKQRAQKKIMHDWKRRARDRIATLKLLHREDSFKTVVGKWAPVVAIALGLRWLAKSKRAKDQPAPTDRDARVASAIQDNTMVLDILSPTERVHPLQNTFILLTDLVESEDSIPTDRALGQMSARKLWSRIARWLEKAKIARPSGAAVSSSSQEWQVLHHVADSLSALAFMSQTLQEGESSNSLSACGRGLLRTSERIDKQFRSWLEQRNFRKELGKKDRADLRGYLADLANTLSGSQPQPGDTFGQVLHDALNAIRIRLLDAVTEPPAESQHAENQAPDDLRSFTLHHGQRVLMRCVKQLLDERASVRELLAKEPRVVTSPVEAEEANHVEEAQESALRYVVTARREEAPQTGTGSGSAAASSKRADAQARTEMQAGSAGSATADRTLPKDPVHSARIAPDQQAKAPQIAPTQTARQHENPALPPDELMRQLAAVLDRNPSWAETVASELVSDRSTEPNQGRDDALSGLIESLAPALRQELLDAVHAALERPKSDLGPN